MRIVDLGALGGGCCSSAAAVNERDEVVGESNGRAFLWRRGTMTDLGHLGGGFSAANDINDRGEVVGESKLADDQDTWHAFLWRDGTMIDLGTLGGRSSRAHGINNRGEVVGFSETAGGATHAFRWAQGRMADLGTVSGTEGDSSYAFDVNRGGVIAGDSPDGMENRAVLWRNGAVEVLPTPPGAYGSVASDVNDRGAVLLQAFDSRGGAAYLHWRGRSIPVGPLPGANRTQAEGLNNHGQVVGSSESDAFVWHRGQMTALPRLGGNAVANDVNDRGLIVGESATTPQGTQPHAVLWTR